MTSVYLATGPAGLARAELPGADVERVAAGFDVRCVSADPRAEHNVYAGTQGGGVLRSDDGGRTWRPSGLDGWVVKSLAISAAAPGRVYAGTKPACLFVSEDRGETWRELTGFRRIFSRRFWFSPAERPFKAYVQGIALSPKDPDLIVAGIEAGAVVRSADAGRSWQDHRRGAMRDPALPDLAWEKLSSPGGACHRRRSSIRGWTRRRGLLHGRRGDMEAAGGPGQEIRMGGGGGRGESELLVRLGRPWGPGPLRPCAGSHLPKRWRALAARQRRPAGAARFHALRADIGAGSRAAAGRPGLRRDVGEPRSRRQLDEVEFTDAIDRALSHPPSNRMTQAESICPNGTSVCWVSGS